MAYNKSKHVENAQKYLHQDKLAQAIGEYQHILKHEPKDQVTLMTIGDLYVRQGETFQALEYFERLAKIFLTDGFVTKAIAIYKKIAKLAPEETRPVERLAELYVQQGVLSEARPIYLQLADLHERAGRQQQAAALLRKLLEAEPDNLRVQTRMAELSAALGRPAEAVAAYLAAAEQLQSRGDHAEAIKYANHALKIRPDDLPASTFKARVLAASGQQPEAVSLLKSLPSLDAGGDATDLLLDLYLDTGDANAASELASKIVAQNPRRFAPAHHVAAALLEGDGPERALELLGLVRGAMADAGNHESLAQSLARACERLPEHIEPREWLVELYERANDSFRLSEALAGLAAVYERSGKEDRALQAYGKLLERDPENKNARRNVEALRARTGDHAAAAKEQEFTLTLDERVAPSAAPVAPEPALDEETQRFVTQALTDVDLFSSYGLTQKAVDQLETIRRRVPLHTPTLERLLDISVGARDDSRTLELASQLEQIYSDRGDVASAKRFAELYRRFERAAGLAAKEVPAEAATPAEFPVAALAAPPDSDSQPVLNVDAELAHSETRELADTPSEAGVHEVDLSEEWAALANQLAEPQASAAGQDAAIEFVITPAETALQDSAMPAIDTPREAEPAAALHEPEAVQDEILSAAPEPHASELPGPTGVPVLSADDFLRSLSGELDEVPSTNAASTAGPSANGGNGAGTPHAPALATGPLSGIFNDFRADMGEHSDEEDPETHYNLGIAYREMGLLDESISEFQKVAKIDKHGRVFRYAMQCYTLLGLAFMEKGQASIAAMWYESALGTPGLDEESILALRYDLGVAQELAGDTSAARKSFTQVYGMNIDYRDVAERLAALGKGQ